jgi:outer membrane lipoprotein-sorting protein
MTNMKKACSVLIVFMMTAGSCFAADAEKIVKDAFDYWRGKASFSTTEMVIHRPDWERRMVIDAWTRGESDSLFVITSPAKDKGNGTLKIGEEMWMYNPKVNRVIKLPPSMMSQAWQGSDFSNNDLAKSDSLIRDYTHSLDGEEKSEGKKVYRITSMPKPDAPVIWGMITMKIREDRILLEETFYDENKKPVKTMTAWDIRPADGRLFPMQWKMRKWETEKEYTLLLYKTLSFKEKMNPGIFSFNNLKNPK